jgi:hypothetical protein
VTGRSPTLSVTCLAFLRLSYYPLPASGAGGVSGEQRTDADCLPLGVERERVVHDDMTRKSNGDVTNAKGKVDLFLSLSSFFLDHESRARVCVCVRELPKQKGEEGGCNAIDGTRLTI